MCVKKLKPMKGTATAKLLGFKKFKVTNSQEILKKKNINKTFPLF